MIEVVVGRVVKAHGLGGEVAVEVRTDEPGLRFAADATVTARRRDGSTHPLTVLSSRPHQERLLVRFTEITTRELAEALRGALLVVDAAGLPPTEDPDEFYDHELEGLAARLPDGTPVGTVLEVAHGPGSDLLVLKLDGGREALVPFVREIVPEVDLETRQVVIDPPEGLLEP